MTSQLFPFQENGVELIEKFKGRCILADEMGLGKSLQALTYLNRHPELRPALIVCPASLKLMWEDQAKKHLNMRVEVLSGRKPYDFGFAQPKILVMNYDLLHYWQDALAKMKLKAIIFDEAHYLQSMTSKRTKAARKLAKPCKHLLFLTGTPMTNRPINLYPLLNMLKPRKWASQLAFGKRFCKAKRHPRFGWDFSGASKTKTLHKILTKSYMIRRLKADVLEDLPAKMRNVVPITLDRQKEYEEAEVDLINFLRKNYGAHAAWRAAKAEAVVKIGHMKRLAAQLKLPQAMEWIDNFLASSDEKLVVFAIHKSIVKELKERYKNAAIVTGDVIGDKRQEQFDKFNTDKDCRVFIGNVQAAGTGWSARKCSNVCFLEMAWSPGEMTQAGDRCHGLFRGEHGKVSTEWWLIAAGTFEERMAKIIQSKQANLDSAIDGKAKKDVTIDVFDQLMAELAKGAK